MAGFLVSSSTGVMNSLLCKLATLLSDEYKLVRGVRNEIGILRDELSSMNSLLQKLADIGELDVQKKEWRDKVRELAYHIEDCIDIFMHRLRPGDDGDGLVRKAVRKIKKLRARHQLAVQIQELKSRVVEASSRRDRYRMDVSDSNTGLVEIDPRLPALYADTRSLVGIDSPRDKIVRWLFGGGSSAKQLDVVSVVGFGCVGKTTLANQAYRKIKGEFQCTVLVSVSQNPNVLKILSDILSHVGFGSMATLNDQRKIIHKIRERFSNKRYAQVLGLQ